MPRKQTKFGTNLKRIRIERKLTLKQMADLVGYTLAYIYNLENGIRTPSKAKAEEFAKKIGVDVNELI